MKDDTEIRHEYYCRHWLQAKSSHTPDVCTCDWGKTEAQKALES